MIVFAADLSLTATGYAVAVGGKVERSGVIHGKGAGIARIVAMRNDFMAQVDAVKPDFVVMEELPFQANASFAKENAGNAYVIRVELFTDNIPFLLVSPTSLKKFVCGTAGSKKEKVGKDRMLKDLFKRWGHDVNDHNEADAIGLAYIGAALCGDWQPVMSAQEEVIASIRASKVQKLPEFLRSRTT